MQPQAGAQCFERVGARVGRDLAELRGVAGVDRVHDVLAQRAESSLQDLLDRQPHALGFAECLALNAAPGDHLLPDIMQQWVGLDKRICVGHKNRLPTHTRYGDEGTGPRLNTQMTMEMTGSPYSCMARAA